MVSVTIQNTGMYIPEKKVYNDYFIKHFDSLNIQVRGLMDHLGRRKRYLSSENETSLTMACNAVKDCIEKSGLDADMIDMLIFTSDIPEYLSPTNALKIVHELDMPNVTVAFDINANCVGMLTAVDFARSYMVTNAKMKYAIIVGSFNISSVCRKNDSVVYPNFGDASAAVLLMREETEEEKGYIESISFLDASYHEYVTFPKCGVSKIAQNNVPEYDKRLEWNPFDMKFISDRWCEMITEILDRRGLTPNDVDYYILSQLSDYDNMVTLDKLGVGEGKYFFLGKEYGYTGNTCLFLVLNRMWNTIAQPGNKVIFCTVGAGYSAIAQLYYF